MDDLELIKQKINIVDLISEYLPLKKAGVNYKANCPFHDEKSASFMVSPERGIWHCFGCQKGGDIFKFVMEKEGIEFVDALEILAAKAGITLQRRKKDRQSSEILFDAHTQAAQFFHFILTEHKLGQKALKYLHDRGVTDATIKEFQIGYAPVSWDSLTKFLKKHGFTTIDIITSGLAVESKNGCYDRFRGRVMFPLCDVRNRVIGFSGRILGVGEPKYINSPQTPIFDKSKFLFGIQLSKTAIKENKEAILVEGEMDMILSYQSGVKNIVGVKGTAFTESQIDLLKRYTDTLSFCFDTDLAGDAAARRSIEIADKAGLNLKVVQISGGKDPAEICLKDPEIWKKAVLEAIPIYDYYLSSVTRRYDVKLATSKKAIFAELLPIWQKISDPMTQDHYIQKLAALLQTPDDVLRRNISEAPAAPPTIQQALSQPKKITETEVRDRRKLLEEYLITLLLHIPITHTYVPNFPESLFTGEDLRQLYVLLVLSLDSVAFKGKSFKIADFTKGLPLNLLELTDRLYLTEVDESLSNPDRWQKELNTVVATLKEMLIRSSLEKLTYQIKSAQSFNHPEELILLNKKFRDLSLKLKSA